MSVQSSEMKEMLLPIRGSELESAIVPQNSKLHSAILDGVIIRSLPIDNYKSGRLVIKGVSMVTSAISKLSYTEIALKTPNFGPFVAFSNGTAFFVLEYWAISGTIDDFLQPRRVSELSLVGGEETNTCAKITTVMTAIVISLLSQIPVALPTLDYDNDYRMAAFIVTVISGSLLPIRSLQLSIEKLLKFRKRKLNEIEQKLQTIQSDMVNLVSSCRNEFVQMGMDEKLKMMESFSSVYFNENETSQVFSYCKKVFEKSKQSPPKKQNTRCEYFGTITGSFLTASFQTALSMYTFDKSRPYVGSDLAAGFTTATVIASGLYLTGDSIIRTAKRVSNSILNLILWKRKPTLSEKISPKLNISFKLLGMLIDIGALGPTFTIWGDYYSYNKTAQGYFLTTVSSSIFLFLLTATFDVVDSIVEEIVQWKGTPEEKAVIEAYKDLILLERLIAKSPLLDVGIFLMNADEDLKQSLTQRIELSKEKLEKYVNERVGLLESSSVSK